MSLSNVKRFYQRLSQDEGFRNQLQKVKNKEECSQLVQRHGYYFTQEEFENYTSELLESSLNEEEGLSDLNEKELETVFGGSIPYLKPFPWPPIIPMYGIPPTDILSQ
ncbi:MAG: Nif11-like leader peptide family natural product precursor [Crocosphaera sp.]|nr:Nif11-like leader peptide family natural product precursor [Crocosphaera sp.]